MPSSHQVKLINFLFYFNQVYIIDLFLNLQLLFSNRHSPIVGFISNFFFSNQVDGRYSFYFYFWSLSILTCFWFAITHLFEMIEKEMGQFFISYSCRNMMNKLQLPFHFQISMDYLFIICKLFFGRFFIFAAS